MAISQEHLGSAWEQALASFEDGRLEFLAYKHKQLYALFESLKTTARSSNVSTLELRQVLTSISQLIDTLPRNLPKHHARQQTLQDLEDGTRETGTGRIVIVRNDSFPIASWVIPLARAIVDGNPALILSTPSSYSIPSEICKSLDPDSYIFAEVPKNQIHRIVETLPSKAGVVSASCEAVTVQGNFRLEHVPLGPTPIIVDQSILTTGRPLLPDEEKRLITPQTVVHAAQQAVTTLSHDNEGASLGHPAYFLVHENVVDPFMRALVPILPSGLRAEVQPLVENRQKIESFLSFLDDRLPTFTPVYTVRSIDAAMDFIQSQSDTARQVYVLGSPAFGAYVANSMRRIDSVLVNAFADSHVGLGPYANSRSFSFTRSRKITSTSLRKPSSHNGRGGLDRIQAWKLSQDPGKRVDFFGGSFLFAGGATALSVIGITGFGLYTLGRWAWALYLR